MVQIHSPRPFFQSDEELETGELKLSGPVFDYNAGMGACSTSPLSGGPVPYRSLLHAPIRDLPFIHTRPWL